MVVCHCRALTDRAIRAAIEAGARDVCELGRCCGAGSRCRGCWPVLRQLLAESGCAEEGVEPRRDHSAA